jgi:DNA-binding NarL/FixJ family response regulator
VGLLFGSKLIGEGRRLLLETQPDFDIVYQESNGLAAITDLSSIAVDVVLIDNRLQGVSGTEVIQRFFRRNFTPGAKLPAFILTGPFSAIDMSIQAVRCGAVNLVTEEDSPQAIIDAVRAAAGPEPQIDFETMRLAFESAGVLSGSNQRWLLRLSDLEPEERRVFDAIAKGQPLDDIKDMTGLSDAKVRWALDAMQAHLGLATRSQFALALHEAGLLQPRQL